MANSNPNYANPIKWGNVKKIEVTKQVIEGWFYQMKQLEQELENIKVSIGSIKYDKDKEIEKLKSEIDKLKGRKKR